MFCRNIFYGGFFCRGKFPALRAGNIGKSMDFRKMKKKKRIFTTQKSHVHHSRSKRSLLGQLRPKACVSRRIIRHLAPLSNETLTSDPIWDPKWAHFDPKRPQTTPSSPGALCFTIDSRYHLRHSASKYPLCSLKAHLARE